MAKQNLQTRSGNRIFVYFDGNKVGLAQNVRLNDDYAPEPASGIGDIHVIEWVPTMARHSVSIGAMVLNTNNLRSLGVAAENGDAVLKGLVFDVVVTDKDSGAVLRKYMGVSFASGDTDVSKHTIVVMNGQYMALDVQGTGL